MEAHNSKYHVHTCGRQLRNQIYRYEERQHLIASCFPNYIISVNMSGHHYCGQTLDWNYKNLRRHLHYRLHNLSPSTPFNIHHIPVPKMLFINGQSPCMENASNIHFHFHLFHYLTKKSRYGYRSSMAPSFTISG